VPTIVGYLSVFLGLTMAIAVLVVPVILTAVALFVKYGNDEIMKS
jgi:hypothetical protein